MRYLRTYPDLPLTLEADNTHVIKWWIDASFAMHTNMKSHTGATMLMGKCLVYSASIRQKLNTKSSTEAELVAADDAIPMVLSTQYFLQAQGVPGEWKGYLPRQREHDIIREEWKSLKRKAHSAH
jgi:hypothetical protein